MSMAMCSTLGASCGTTVSFSSEIKKVTVETLTPNKIAPMGNEGVL